MWSLWRYKLNTKFTSPIKLGLESERFYQFRIRKHSELNKNLSQVNGKCQINKEKIQLQNL